MTIKEEFSGVKENMLHDIPRDFVVVNDSSNGKVAQNHRKEIPHALSI